MIDIKVLASGSSGNCTLISHGKTMLMIDCGIPVRDIENYPAFKLSDIGACLITHEHGDHTRSVGKLIKLGVPCYMTRGTSGALDISSGTGIKTLNQQEIFTVGDFVMYPFSVFHDAVEPVGFLISVPKTNEDACFITDTRSMQYIFPPLNYYMVECNYTIDILNDNFDQGIINKKHVLRIIDNHMELNAVKLFFESQDLSRTKRIYLLHVSEINGDKDFFKSEIMKLTGKEVWV